MTQPITVLANITRELKDTPKLRYAVLPLANGGGVVYDRLTQRIVDGVYYMNTEEVMAQAYYYELGLGREDMSPNAAALGLVFPSEKIIRLMDKDFHRTKPRSKP